ncbi:MAG: carboxylesterase family protein [Myxococcales bacterium]|nr:carboxylesterase family protein [Myxococcales bacterium]
MVWTWLGLACTGPGSTGQTTTTTADTAVPVSTADTQAPTPECGEETPPGPGVAHTTVGAVLGTDEGGVHRWLGIPFAEPPVADLRFRPPVPASCADEALVADTWTASCPQLDAGGTYVGEEDCLTLNVWAPQGAADLPVLVFLHGGGHQQGSASVELAGAKIYDGAHLARAGAVVVTVQYRLGILGFLAHPDLTAESGGKGVGNYGFLDQIEALRWVADNAPAFGGDPSKVVVFGESAGAVSTCRVITSPLAEGLVSGAILQSGGCPATPLADAEEVGVSLVSELSCDGADPLACLREMPATELVATAPGGASVLTRGMFDGVIDGWAVPDLPWDVIARGEHHQVPLIVGANADETGLEVPSIPDAEAFDTALRAQYPFAPDTLIDAIRAAYPLEDYPSPRAAMVALTSDLRFICPSRRLARSAAANQKAPVYRYLYDHILENSGLPGQIFGAYHGLELWFVFGTMSDRQDVVLGASDQAVIDAMQAAWLSFANGEPPLKAWTSTESKADWLWRFEDPGSVVDGVRAETCDFWDALVP